MFEHKAVVVPLLLISCAIGYCDYSVDCTKEYVAVTSVSILPQRT